jgi:hypothetical protein
VVWTARVAWIVLPFTTGAALGDVIEPWTRAPETVAAILLWTAWFAGLVALLAPRPWGYTTLRVVAPCALTISVISAWSAPGPTATLAIASAAVATVSALSSQVAHACAASTAYGPERRFPLRAPISLLAGPLPVSIAIIAAGIAAGPLLLANHDYIAGAIALVVGAPVVAALIRSIAALDHRWIVLVPAGLVVVDPLTFPDPVLLPREQIEQLRLDRHAQPDDREHTDIMVGGSGPLLLTCRETGSFLRRAGRGQATLEADRLRLSPLRPSVVLTAAGAHRIPVA